MSHSLPLVGRGHMLPGPRRVDVVRVELFFIIDHDRGLLEMKVAQLAGGRPDVTMLGHATGSLTDDPAVHVDVVRPLLLRLLEEYCEPF